MKNQLTFFLCLAIAGLAFITSCSDDEDPTVVGSITVNISGLPSGEVAAIEVSGPNSFTATVESSTTLSDLAVGVYTFTIPTVDAGGDRFVSSESEISVNITDDSGETVDIEYAEFSTVNGIVGTWVSAGDNVAPLLVTLFAVDSIVAIFNANQTYTVEQYAGGVTAPLTLSGTYSQSLASGSIWEITVDQTSPAALTSEGIFQIDTSSDPDGMQYEIAQTSPDIGAIPPNATDGFGSTSGGVLGDQNIQNYERRAF